MGFLDGFNRLNPFAKDFNNNQKFEDDILDQIERNSVGMSDAEYELQELGMNPPKPGPGYGDVVNNSITFNDIFNSKRQRIAKYREMSYYPEIQEALDIICDESIVKDVEGNVSVLDISKELPVAVETKLRKEYDHISNTVFKSKDNQLYDLFNKWLVEGELFVEYILNDKKNGIIGYKTLPAFTTYPVYGQTGTVRGYIQVIKGENGREERVPLQSNQVSYVHWGKYGRDLLDVRGYLESSVRTYNQLKNLEDSLIVYRLVRAPERRVWNIEVGRVPTGKAEQYIRKVIHKYKKSIGYNTTDGSIDSQRNIHSLSEDFWFAKRDGQGTNVDVLQSGMNLGELDDVRYFLTKMYKTLKIPKTRWDSSITPTTYSNGRDIEREELKFTLFISRMQNRFKKVLKEAFLQHIKFKYGKDPKMAKHIKNTNIFDIKFNAANFFKEYKDLEMLESRLNILSTAVSFVASVDEPANPFSMEFIMRNERYFNMSDEDWEANKKLREAELKSQLEDEEEFGDDEDMDDEVSDEEVPAGDSEEAPEEAPEEVEEESVNQNLKNYLKG